jgi:hypothetical protein
VLTQYGNIWTSILNPGPSFGALDGMGLVGPPMPAYTTGSVTPTWTMNVNPVPPLGGVMVLFQAYSVDTARYPAPESILISNVDTKTFN